MVVGTIRRHTAFPDNSAVPPNSTVWAIPTDAGRSLQADIVACAVVTYLIAVAFVVLRFYTRGWVNHVLGSSDWCILPALLCAAGVTASSLDQMAHGAGKHSWEADPLWLPAFGRAAWYGILFYNLGLTLTRISILLLYKRIFTYTWIRRAIWVVLILVVGIGIWFVVSVFTACIPLRAFWDWSLFFTTDVHCQPVTIWWANAAFHIASDLVIMALPMPVLSSLTIPRRHKYAIVGVFAFGFFVCIISVVRLVALTGVVGQPAYDATYTSANIIYWTTVEVNAAISCACIMTLKPLIQRFFPRLLSPSGGFREPTLQWVTPARTGGHRDNHVGVCNDRRSLPGSTASPASPPHRHTQRPSSASNHTTSKNSGNSATASHEPPPQFQFPRRPSLAYSQHGHDNNNDQLEKSRYYHGIIKAAELNRADTEAAAYDLDRSLDLEARRTCGCSGAASSSSTIPTTSAFVCAAATAGVRAGPGTGADAGSSAKELGPGPRGGEKIRMSGMMAPLDPAAARSAPFGARLS